MIHVLSTHCNEFVGAKLLESHAMMLGQKKWIAILALADSGIAQN